MCNQSCEKIRFGGTHTLRGSPLFFSGFHTVLQEPEKSRKATCEKRRKLWKQISRSALQLGNKIKLDLNQDCRQLINELNFIHIGRRTKVAFATHVDVKDDIKTFTQILGSSLEKMNGLCLRNGDFLH
jgi:hypothetical protein